MADASTGFGRKDCGLSLFGMSNYELTLSSKQMYWCNDVLLDWSRAGLPHPTAPPARDGTVVDELEDLRLRESEGIQPIGDQRYDGMRNGKCS